MKNFLKYNRQAQTFLIIVILMSILLITLLFTDFISSLFSGVFLGLFIITTLYLIADVCEQISISEYGISTRKYFVHKIFIPWHDVVSITIEENQKLKRRNKTSMVKVTPRRNGQSGKVNSILVQFRPEVIDAIASSCSLPIRGIGDLVDEGCLEESYKELEHRGTNSI